MREVETSIYNDLVSEFSPVHLAVLNESDQHNVPPGSESHFKVIVVADAFEGVLPVARHKMVYKTLAEQLNSGVHALSIHCYTSKQWTDAGEVIPDSPPCLGGSKFDNP